MIIYLQDKGLEVLSSIKKKKQQQINSIFQSQSHIFHLAGDNYIL